MLERILNSVSKNYTCDWKEVTMESNPDDLHQANLDSWKSLAIDRLSLGIQSFDENVLKSVSRVER